MIASLFLIRRLSDLLIGLVIVFCLTISKIKYKKHMKTKNSNITNKSIKYKNVPLGNIKEPYIIEFLLSTGRGPPLYSSSDPSFAKCEEFFLEVIGNEEDEPEKNRRTRCTNSN